MVSRDCYFIYRFGDIRRKHIGIRENRLNFLSSEFPESHSRNRPVGESKECRVSGEIIRAQALSIPDVM